MSVHYRFKSALEYDTITFDGLHISVKDLKNAIIQQKRIGKSTDFDLRITNAQTQEVYEDDNALIPKNTSLLIARIPVTAPKQKQWEGYGGNDTPPSKLDEGGPVGKAVDLANLDAPEDDKIKAMMSQSTQDYDPSNYMKIRGANQVGPVPTSYRCYKCHQNGHWIKDCPLGQAVEPLEIKKSTGIPHSFMVPVEGPQVPGAMMMSNGQYAVPALDLQAYNQKPTGPNPVQEPKPEIPEDLLCSICSDLLTDAVMIPCCGNSFCDECIRSVLLESEDHECPDCHEKDISPTTLIPNRFLRKSVANFKNTTGYEKKPVFKPKPDIPKEEPVKKSLTPPPPADSTEKENLKEEEKTVISEADSTEHAKAENDFSKDAELEIPKTEDMEGPPGVSPKNSPLHRITSKISKGGRERSSRDRDHRNKHPKHRRSRTPSPRKSRNRSESFEARNSADRHGTPTRDEPPGIGTNYGSPTQGNSFTGPPNDTGPPGINSGVPPLQGHPVALAPGTFHPGRPPPFHPAGVPPNFRMPPPGGQPPPFMGPGPFPVGPRPIFDPMNGPPGGFVGNFGGRARDFGVRRGGRDRTPPGLIDDPLAAFNRILREKDEKRARQQRMARRSWSRSRSRSFSRSPPPLRKRSRSPRRRTSRSRSRSFSISRSRSRSFSHSPRGSPLPPLRRSPPPLQARRGPAGRFRSPHRSPPARRRIDRDRNEFDRDYDRSNFRDKPKARRANSRDRFYDDRDRDFDRGSRGRAGPPPVPVPMPQPQWGGQRDTFYPPQEHPGPGFQNRFPQQIHHIQPDRKYEEIAPPGVEQPPIPGLEEPPPPNDFEKQKSPPRKEKDKYISPKDRDKDRKDREKRREEKRSRSKTKTPEKWRNPSPKSSGTPDRPRRRRTSTDSRDEKRRERDRHRDHSEDEKKKSKEKKKHREKKDDKKKKKEKKDRHKTKDRKDKKEEFKQVIPKGSASGDEDPDIIRKKIEERKKQREEEENKKLQEERKKEERRLRFLEDEKRKKEEEAKKKEAKKEAIREARKLLEEEERLRLEKEQARLEKEQARLEKEQPILQIQQEHKTTSLYDEVIPEQDLAKEILDFKQIDVKPVVTVVTEQPLIKEELSKHIEEKEMEEGEVTDDQEAISEIKEGEEEDASILEIHSDMDIKLDETDILAPVPEKSKWEVDEDGQLQNSPSDNKELCDSKSKVSSEVLKRAENVIFARAINSIRPIEIKKITGERAKLYADEKPVEEPPKKVEVVVEKPRLSVKERLGKKVDEPDPKVILIDSRRSSSPFNRRGRRIEIESHRRPDRRHSRGVPETNRDRERHKSRTDRSTDKSKRNRKEEKDKHDDRSKEKRKRTRSRSPSEEPKKKKKEKKLKKEKDKTKKHEEENKKEEHVEEKPKSAVEKRKTTLDEASFEPDYDLELHDDDTSEHEKEPKKDKETRKAEVSEEDSSSSESTSSSSEEERKRRKRKLRKKKKRRETSSSESESSSDSSDSEKERKRRKHRKIKKKKKKAKHK